MGSSSSSSRHKKRKHRKHKQKHRHQRKHKKHTSSSSSSESSSQSKSDAGHFEYKIGMRIKKGQFEITKFLGDGTFGRVVEVKNDNKYYAMKCIRAVERYIESAKIETKILWQIQERDKDGRYQIVRLHTSFSRYGNYFLIFERLGKSLYDIIKKNKFQGFPIKYVQSFFRQMLMSVGFLHSMQLTHTDLKPENILITDCALATVPMPLYKQSNNSTSTNGEDDQNKIYVPECDTIKIIDFGGATFSHEYHSTVINTRQYRAPEVILGGIKWDCSSDIWCIACIVLELYTGTLFFNPAGDSYQNKEDIEHLAMIEKIGGPIPSWMIGRGESKMSQLFCLDNKYFQQHHTYFEWPQNAPSRESVQRVKDMKTIEQIVHPEHVSIVDLLKRMLVPDPLKRLTCHQALLHPFFTMKYS